MGVKSRDVKGTQAFILKFAMFDDGTVAQNQLGHRVGEIPRVGCADVTFEHRQLAVFFGND